MTKFSTRHLPRKRCTKVKNLPSHSILHFISYFFSSFMCFCFCHCIPIFLLRIRPLFFLLSLSFCLTSSTFFCLTYIKLFFQMCLLSLFLCLMAITYASSRTGRQAQAKHGRCLDLPRTEVSTHEHLMSYLSAHRLEWKFNQYSQQMLLIPLFYCQFSNMRLVAVAISYNSTILLSIFKYETGGSSYQLLLGYNSIQLNSIR